MDGFWGSGGGSIFKHMGMTPWPRTNERKVGLKTFIEHPTSGRCSKCQTNQTTWVEIDRTRGITGPALCETCQLNYACDLLTQGSLELTAKSEEVRFKNKQVQTFAQQIIDLKTQNLKLNEQEGSLRQRIRDLESRNATLTAMQDVLHKKIDEIANVLWAGAAWADGDILPYIKGLIADRDKLVQIANLVLPKALTDAAQKPKPWGGVLPKPKDWDRFNPPPSSTGSTPTAPMSVSINWGGEDLSLPKKR